MVPLSGRRLATQMLAPARSDSRLTFARSTSALQTDSSGVWQASAINAARFNGAAGRLLIEGDRSNLIRNPRAEGGTVATVNLPTNWTFVGSGGLSRELVAVVSENGLPGAHIRFFGTATGSNLIFSPETASAIAASGGGQTFNFSAFLRNVATSAPPSVTRIRVYGRTSGGAMSTSPAAVAITPSATLSRFSSTFSLPVDATTAFVQPALSWDLVSGQSYDFTVGVFAPQVEQEAFTSTPMLPPVGTPGVSTRAADRASFPVSGGSGGLALSFLLPQDAAGAPALGLLQVDNGSNSNRIVVRCAAGGASIEALVVSGGSTVATMTLGSITAGVASSVAVAWTDSEVRAQLSGAAEQTATVSAPAGLTTARIGVGSSDWSAAAFGEIGNAVVSSVPVAPSILLARV